MIKPLRFLQETRDELSKVIWPNQQEVIRLTGVVIIVSLVVGLYIGGLDFLFTNLVTILIK